MPSTDGTCRRGGSTVKREYCHEVNDEELRKDVWAKCYDEAYAVACSGNTNKHARGAAFDAIVEKYLESMDAEEADAKNALVKRYYHDVEKEAMRRSILDEGKRLDGRTTTEIRPIWCEVDYLPGPHGSSIFTRGETQSLSTVTLGTKLDEKIVDDVLDQSRDRFCYTIISRLLYGRSQSQPGSGSSRNRPRKLG